MTEGAERARLDPWHQGLSSGDGKPAKRLLSEDAPFLSGSAQFIDDLPSSPDMLHAAFVRSPYAHARVMSIDPIVADFPGIVGIFSNDDLNLPDRVPKYCDRSFSRPVLARHRVRFLGEPIVVVVARSRALAIDTAETIMIDYDPLEPVLDPLAAELDTGSIIHEDAGTNVAWQATLGHSQVDFSNADVVVSSRFVNQRVAAAPIEPNGVVAIPEGAGLRIWMPTKAPYWARREIAAALALDEQAVRVIVPSVGGGFGPKSLPYPEQIVVAALSLKLKQGVRYVETRSESLLSMCHGRAQVQDIELGAKRDGTIVGLKARVVQDGGAYPDHGAFLAEVTFGMTSGAYVIPDIEFSAICVATNTTPIASYRGAGRPEATSLIERAMDMLALELSLDPVELRVRNLIQPDAFPFTTATGASYDSGDYQGTLKVALEHLRYDDARREQANKRINGEAKQLGIGVCCYVEVTGFGSEFASVSLGPGCNVVVSTGVQPTGQGLDSSLSQIVAETLGVPTESIEIVHSDTGVVPRGEGTWGSRSLQRGGSAVLEASVTLLGKAKALAAHLLEASPVDVIHLPQGGFGLTGVPDVVLSWQSLIRRANEPGVPKHLCDLRSDADFGENKSSTYPFGTHLALVLVDTEVGKVELIRHIAVDDAGRILNHAIAEGQIHGGVAQGIGQALYEEIVYDEMGNLLTGNLATYGLPTANEVPFLETSLTETPTTLNPLGSKGIGESGVIGATVAIQNAVIDAVSYLGVRHMDMPMKPEKVWKAIRSASWARAGHHE